MRGARGVVAVSKMCRVPLLVALALASLGVCANGDDDTYLIGAGRYDVTGPAAEIEMV